MKREEEEEAIESDRVTQLPACGNRKQKLKKIEESNVIQNKQIVPLSAGQCEF